MSAMPEFILRYRDGPLKGLTEKKLRIGKGLCMSFGHGSERTFHLPKEAGISDNHVAIHNKGTLEDPSLVLRRGQGKTQIWVYGLPKPRDFIDLPDKDVPIEHGMLIRMGKHTFEVIDPKRLAKPLNLVYEDGPLKGKFKPVKLAIASRNRMTIGYKQGASIPLPQGNGIKDSHAYIEKRFRRMQFEPELFHLVGDKGTTYVDSPYFPRYPLKEGQSHELHHGTLIQIGPHTLRVVDPSAKATPDSTRPKPATANETPTPPAPIAAHSMAGLSKPAALDEPVKETPRKAQNKEGGIWSSIKGFFSGFSKEAREKKRQKRQQTERLRKYWERKSDGMTFEQFQEKVIQEEEQYRRWSDDYSKKVAERTQRCVTAMQTIRKLAPQTTPKSAPEHIRRLLDAIEKVKWVGSSLDFTEDPNAWLKTGLVVDENSLEFKQEASQVAATLFELRNHPDSRLRKEIDEALGKLTCRYDFIAMSSPQMSTYREKAYAKYRGRNWGGYMPHEVE